MTHFISFKKEINIGQFIIYKNQLIGEGSFGKIYIGLNTETSLRIAVKIESSQEVLSPVLSYESAVLGYLQGAEGFPELYGFSSFAIGKVKYSCMFMELLGDSIEDILSSSKINLRESLLLSLQMLTRIEHLHNLNIIHRDIKPSNFLLGKGKNKNILYLCDFGLAKKYVEDGKHIPYVEGKKLVGTVRFTSIYSHMGIELSRRDDLESLLYSILYIIKGSLPWQGIKAKTRMDKERKILEIKLNTTIGELCKGIDEEFSCLFQYVKYLRFTEKPDYSYMKSILEKIFNNHNFENCNGELFFDRECKGYIKQISKSV